MPHFKRANAWCATLTIALLGQGGVAEATCQLGTPIAGVLIRQYIATPSSMLLPDYHGVEGLRTRVRSVAATGAEAITAVLSTVPEASAAEQKAIGRGLGEAASACLMQDSAIVQRIKDAVRSSGSRVVSQSFMAAFEDNTGGDPTALSSRPAKTQGPAADRTKAPVQNLLPVDPANAGKLPNPFGTLDEWR